MLYFLSLAPVTKSCEKKYQRVIWRFRNRWTSSFFMAVDARHPNLFSPQIFSNGDMGNFVQGKGTMYGAGAIGYGVVPGPVSGTTTAETLIPMYGSAAGDSFRLKTPLKSDSALTYGIPDTRKRPREDAAAIHRIPQSLLPFPPNVQNQLPQQQTDCNNHHRDGGSFTFLGEDISMQIQQQQLEMNRLIAQQTERVRMEIEERRKRYSRTIVAAVEERVVKKLRAKEEEINKIGKLNWALEERVKSLCVENQIWRDLAQTNESNANALRSNLEQVLARANNGGEDAVAAIAMVMADNAESCCGSNDNIVAEREIKEDGGGWMMCRSCGKEESSVLVLPCRHLCLCSSCGPSLHICPICKSTKNATLHVNLSSSS